MGATGSPDSRDSHGPPLQGTLQFINYGSPRPQMFVHLEQQEVDAEIVKAGKQPLAAPQARGNRTLLERGAG